MTAAENSIRFSDHTIDKATKAKVTLENFYSNLITQHGERKQRLAKLEASLKDEALTESQKQVCLYHYLWDFCLQSINIITN